MPLSKLGRIFQNKRTKKHKNDVLDRNKMAEEEVDVEYISLHGYIRDTPSDTEVQVEHRLRADWST